MDIAVSHSDKKEVHVGGIDAFRSTDSGEQWERVTHWLRDDPLPFIHADIDQITYRDNRIYYATDGGLFVSSDKGNSFEDYTTGLGIRQFYRIDVSADGELIAGGSQDNGTGLYRNSNGWWDFVGADGMEPLIDHENPDRIYASIQYGNLYRTSDGGLTLDGDLVQTPGFGDWVTPLVADPIEHGTIYQGKSQLYKSTDGIQSWTKLTAFKNKNPLDTSLQEVVISPVDNNLILAAYSEQLYKSDNGGETWQDISPPFYFSNINYISLHPHDKNWIAMTLSGNRDRVVQSTDGGKTWNSLMDGLPSVGAESVMYEGGPKNGIYVTMNPGIYYRNSSQPQWRSISENLPLVVVAELDMSDCDLYAATFGRGLWQGGLMDDTEYYADNDGDGYGDDATATQYCSAPDHYILQGGDCDDNDASVFPGNEETCNGVDDNCDGLLDAEDSSLASSVWYEDADADGYGNRDVLLDSCRQPEGYVANADDCNDNNLTINPKTEESCNGIDDNCDGIVDNIDALIASDNTWYEDADGDGYGNELVFLTACTAPVGYVQQSGDCVDNDSSIYPSAEELCDGIDNNCDDLVDDNCNTDIDCDGGVLFIRRALKPAYYAGEVLMSNAELVGDDYQLFAAGSSIELMPGFEVVKGKEFEAKIEPCFNGVTPLNFDMENEISILEQEIYNRMSVGELVQVRVIDSQLDKTISVIYSKNEVRLHSILKSLNLGDYVIHIQSTSIAWNKAFRVVS